jgi:hypothetical protein
VSSTLHFNLIRVCSPPGQARAVITGVRPIFVHNICYEIIE